MSTPSPRVSRKIPFKNESSLELNILFRVILNLSMIYRTFSSVPTVTYTSAPSICANWTAARPTPPQALWISTLCVLCQECEYNVRWNLFRALTCPFCSPPTNIRLCIAVAYGKNITEALSKSSSVGILAQRISSVTTLVEKTPRSTIAT